MEEGLREETEIKENVAFSREREKAGGRAPGLPQEGSGLGMIPKHRACLEDAEEMLLAGWNSRVI